MKIKSDRPQRTVTACAAALAFVCALAVPGTSAFAQPHRRAAPPGWHGDISRFHEHDWGVWRGGRWIHDRHEGRLGWWWLAGGMWYFYPAPVYPYPDPWAPAPQVLLPAPVETAQPVPPTAYWYYCEPSKAYYPYAASCTQAWTPVPAKSADVPVQSK